MREHSVPGIVPRPALALERKGGATDPQLADALDMLVDPFVLMTPIRDGFGRVKDFRIVYANRAYGVHLDMDTDRIVGQRLLALMPGSPVPGLLRRLDRVLSSGRPLLLNSTHYRGIAGGRFSDRYYDLRASRNGAGLGLSLRDVTARELSFQRQRAVDDRLRTLMRAAPVGLASVSSAGLLVEVNDGLCKLVGREADELSGTSVADLVPVSERAEMSSVLERLVEQEASEIVVDLHAISGEGEQVGLRLSARAVLGAGSGEPSVILQFQDVSDARQVDDALTFQALHDSLTGLPNRTLVLDRLAGAVQRARRAGSQLGVFFCDLDHLKDINDRLGHAAGDRVLVATAERITESMRAADTAGRLGGDEFVVVSENVVDPAHAELLSRRLRDAIQRPIVIEGERVSPSVSIGVALAGAVATDPVAVLREADTALYQAKQAGRSRAVVFDEQMQTRLASRRRLETDVRRAVADGLLRVHYQPVVHLPDERPVGYEALVRMRDGRRVVRPAELLPLAERAGVVSQLRGWVLEQAASFLAHHERAGFVTVNLTSRELLSGDVSGEVSAACARHGVDPGRLRVDVAEGFLSEPSQGAAEQLRALRGIGVEIAVDDFGTGVSALSALRDIPVSAIKIDRSIIATLPAHGKTQRVVRALLALGDALGLEVIAEGVETRGQAGWLASAGCELAQGHLFGKPVPEGRLPMRDDTGVLGHLPLKVGGR